jgi:hypothetical protein
VEEFAPEATEGALGLAVTRRELEDALPGLDRDRIPYPCRERGRSARDFGIAGTCLALPKRSAKLRVERHAQGPARSWRAIVFLRISEEPPAIS